MPRSGRFTNQILQAKKRKVQLAMLALLFLDIFALGMFYGKLKVENFFINLTGLAPQMVRAEAASFTQSGDTQIISQTMTSTVNHIDQRAYVLDEYFKANGSPLYGTGSIFVAACDRYGAPRDCVTVAAIARAETNLCKYHTSAEYFNCWGFGGGGEYRMRFSSWEESIDLVTSRLATSYGYKYMVDPSLMEKTFCGSEPGCTGWGNRVKFFMNEIDQFPYQLGFDQPLAIFR